jgi:hypothetical protein
MQCLVSSARQSSEEHILFQSYSKERETQQTVVASSAEFGSSAQLATAAAQRDKGKDNLYCDAMA